MFLTASGYGAVFQWVGCTFSKAAHIVLHRRASTVNMVHSPASAPTLFGWITGARKDMEEEFTVNAFSNEMLSTQLKNTHTLCKWKDEVRKQTTLYYDHCLVCTHLSSFFLLSSLMQSSKQQVMKAMDMRRIMPVLTMDANTATRKP